MKPLFPLVLASFLLLSSCSTLLSGLMDDSTWSDDRTNTVESDDTPDISDFDASILGSGFLGRSFQAVQRAHTDITPQQEYYLGRAFGATVLQSLMSTDRMSFTVPSP